MQKPPRQCTFHHFGASNTSKNTRNQKTKSAVANFNENRLPSALVLYDSLLGVLESECLLNVTVEDIVKKLFTDFFTTAPAEEREKLIINVLELLVNDIKLVQYDLFWIIEIISNQYKGFMESDLIYNVINKSNKKYIILTKLHNIRTLICKKKNKTTTTKKTPKKQTFFPPLHGNDKGF